MSERSGVSGMVSQVVVVLLTPALVRAVIFREETNCDDADSQWFCNCDGKLKVSEFCNTLHFRAEEKRILDSVMGPAVYDSRIRPAGINGTGEKMSTEQDTVFWAHELRI